MGNPTDICLITGGEAYISMVLWKLHMLYTSSITIWSSNYCLINYGNERAVPRGKG